MCSILFEKRRRKSRRLEEESREDKEPIRPERDKVGRQEKVQMLKRGMIDDERVNRRTIVASSWERGSWESKTRGHRL